METKGVERLIVNNKIREYSGLDVSGMLYYFDTLEEALKYYSGFPSGSYQISKRGVGIIV